MPHIPRAVWWRRLDRTKRQEDINYKYKYQLTEDFVYPVHIHVSEVLTEYLRIDNIGLLHIKKGYCWDGPRGPTYDTPSAMRASLVHDAMYQLIRMGKLSSSDRPFADKLLYQICLEDGMWKIRGWLWYQVVKRFAGWAAKPNSQMDEIFFAGGNK